MQERPAYLRIAAELREQITRGDYPPGSRLPTLARLCRMHGVSEIVARQAIALLRGEGLVETRRGGGTVVRARPAARRIAMSRYRNDPAATAPATSFTRDQRIGWDAYRLDRAFARVRADPHLASLLEVAAGTWLLRRRFVFYARDEPQQLSVSYLPWSLVRGTPVADPAREPWPGGTPAQLAYLGRPVTRVEESVRARMPTPEEVETLRMAAGVPVLAVTRRMLSGGRPCEVCRDIVIPADRVILDYAIDL
ncbi:MULTISPECIES: GntR family transcriptional regulator [Thermomonospora]|uniref:Transcriptional regulator, GntR family n=1 Tax=Thermomonospora curvata (strain ATCC 19995 / DSM 43183 / JCM 3096 / KCTC 9072 / NBRC 15933 / NCIMB 10081 / Henssen B9) TaxID=471852 RepID=D1ABV9_THECD|nr:MULTISPECIES: GntR family transcriptional regulator [Thermomonospora]ACY99132.1 transcriptional regulator, GntR family [Thermomonospora curvata DSM 43183]PKK13312.1 MAG: GntR family transcriptional regulator [Thermomonospora sp. CIF 1]